MYLNPTHQTPADRPPSASQTPPIPSGGGVTGASTSSGSTPVPAPDSSHQMAPVKLEDKERRSLAMAILKLLCDSPLLQEHMLDMLTSK